jgi:hypothetical protein
MHIHDSTFFGLHKWTYYMFEKLGWMAKAHKHHNKLKIDAYLDSVKRLHESLEHKLRKTRDADRKDDLRVLIEHVECLKACAHTLLMSSSSTGSEKEHECVGGKAHEATNCGIGKWVMFMYEKLGWMCLAKKHGHELKVRSYLDSIQNLKSSIELKIKHVHEADRKDDLKIHLEDACTLQAAANKLLSDEGYHSHMHKRTRRSSHRSKRSNHTKRTKKQPKH